MLMLHSAIIFVYKHKTNVTYKQEIYANLYLWGWRLVTILSGVKVIFKTHGKFTGRPCDDFLPGIIRKSHVRFLLQSRIINSLLFCNVKYIVIKKH